GRPALRGGRDRQGRRQAGDGGRLRADAEDHADRRRLVRRRQLRHVRARLRPAISLHLAERAHQRDGRRAGGERAGDAAARRARRAGQGVVSARGGGVQGADPRALRQRGFALFRHRAALGRRRDRAGADAPRAEPGLFGLSERADRDDEVRRVQDVSLAGAPAVGARHNKATMELVSCRWNPRARRSGASMGFPSNLGTALIVAALVGAAAIAPGFAAGRAPSIQAAPPAAEPTPSPEATPARVAHCEKGGDGFDAWLTAFKREAASQDISSSVIESALADVAYDESVVSRDRGQGVFRQSFEEFSGRMISPYRLKKGRSLLKRYADTFRAIEQRYGAPGPVLVAIWGLETDFGAGTGDFKTLDALATLAFDCRRSEKFRAELMDALRVVQRGDIEPAAMHGAWAGEIGQTQFMPSAYFKYAVAFDGKGKADLINDSADALASTANFLHGHGWKRDAGWDEDEPNFAVLLEWNQAKVY